MQNRKFYPKAVLQPYVRYYLIAETDKSDYPSIQTAFPLGGLELIIYLETGAFCLDKGGKKRLTSFYTGHFTKPFVLSFQGKSRYLIINLQPWAGRALFNIPASEFTDRNIDTCLIEGNTNLRERLMECTSDKNLIATAEGYLMEKLFGSLPDKMVSALVTELLPAPNFSTVQNFLEKISISRRWLERKFMEETGLSMGMFIKKLRFQKAVWLMNTNPAYSLTYIGHEVGYYDQSHFINSFKEFAGITPKQYPDIKFPVKNLMEEFMLYH